MNEIQGYHSYKKLLFNQFYNLLEVIGGLDRRVAELALFVLVIVYRYVGVLKFMPGQYAGHYFVRTD